MRALEMLAATLFWWHPVVWWARRELREAEEQCCDAWVLWALPEAGRAYATALVDTLDFLSEARDAVPVLASGVGHVHDLKRRLTMIMRGTTPRSLTWTGCLGLAAVALVLLPVVPTWAQTEDIQKEIEKVLQERLRALEREHKELQDRRIELRKVDDKAGAGEQLEQARRQVKQLAEQLERTRAQMKDAEAQLKQAMDRLAQLEGRGGRTGTGGFGTGGFKEQEKIIIIIKDADGKTRTIEVPPGDVKRFRELNPDDVLKRIELKLEPGAVPKVPPRPPVPLVPPGGPRPGAPAADPRLRDLEKMIDALMKEIESLRREMKGPGRGGKEPEGIQFEYKLDDGKFRLIRPAPSPNPQPEDTLYFFRKIEKP